MFYELTNQFISPKNGHIYSIKKEIGWSDGTHYTIVKQRNENDDLHIACYIEPTDREAIIVEFNDLIRTLQLVPYVKD